MCASSASRLCECWLPDERPAPNCVRTVSAISRGAAGHERQLGRLVEQLVEAHAEEVEVHELDDRPHARHRRADAEAHDRASRRSGVSRTRSPNRVVQAAREAEHVAAGADVDAGDEDALVGLRARPRARSRIASIVRNTGASSAPAPAAPGARAAARVDEVGRASRRRARAAAGRRRPRRRARARPPTRSASSASSATPGRAEPARVDDERVARLPLLQLLGRCGSAAGRPRSGRASGRSWPRRSTGPPPARTRGDHVAASRSAVATTSLPSTAT